MALVAVEFPVADVGRVLARLWGTQQICVGIVGAGRCGFPGAVSLWLVPVLQGSASRCSGLTLGLAVECVARPMARLSYVALGSADVCAAVFVVELAVDFVDEPGEILLFAVAQESS